MCGIVTIFNYNSNEPVDRKELLRIRDHMVKRGPDGCGEWYSRDNRIGLGHRRLAIIDLSESGAQPMSNEDGTVWITFNGEIYNYRALGERLKAKGHRFKSNSDTEVIIHGYEEWGIEALLKQLRGMFAFALLDSRLSSSLPACQLAGLPASAAPRLIIARDPFGIKPLYYSDDGKTFRAASQVKALLAGGRIDTSPEPAGHVGFFLWGHVPEPYTLYKGIRALPAGSYMSVSASQPASLQACKPVSLPIVYCSIPEIFAEAEKNSINLSKEEMQERLRAALLDSVKHHLIADVPVGVFLSAGLDSGTLVGLASEIEKSRIHTVTLAFKEYVDTHNDEAALSSLVADYYHTLHETVWVEKKDFQDEMEILFQAMDQPTTDGVNSYFVSKAAVKSGLKVALSGLGGDELFGSYPSFRQVPKMTRLFRPFSGLGLMGRGFRAVSAPVMKHFTSPKYAGLLEYGGSYGGAYLLRRGMFMPWELPEVLDGEMVKQGWRELQTLIRLEDTIHDIKGDYLKVSMLETCWYMRNQLLRDTDWASMAHSLEVRVPLVDVGLLEELVPLLSISGRPGKTDLAHVPSRPLPPEIVNKGKTGFSVPVREWLPENRHTAGGQGLRGWAKFIYGRWVEGDERQFAIVGREKKMHHLPGPNTKSIRVLALVTDAFGGHGGIALYNRDVLSALCEHPGCREVLAIPRLVPNTIGPLPDGLAFATEGIGGKIKYVRTVLRTLGKDKDFDVIVCGHINLLPLAYPVSLWLKVPILLEIYGIDAWQPTKSALVNYLAGRVDWFVSISDITSSRFLKWTRLPQLKGFLLPNAIHMEAYGPGEKDQTLLDRYRLSNRTVMMTLGRMVGSERYKGFDLLMDLLPELAERIPDISYLIAGDGPDRPRLEKKAKALGMSDRVIFTGLIPEEEKAAHYRLADVYAMPSRGEGFGFVFLEAMACGIPVVASKLDGSREAVREGTLGVLVNPLDRGDVISGVISALSQQRGVVPEGLEYFSFGNFTGRLHAIIDKVLAAREN
jgi:asparagine synthase (glutamine-hydrolysing)